MAMHQHAPSFQPVDGRWLLVSAEVRRERENIQVREVLRECVHRRLHALADHVHAHGVARHRPEPHVHITPADVALDLRACKAPSEAERRRARTLVSRANLLVELNAAAIW